MAAIEIARAQFPTVRQNDHIGQGILAGALVRFGKWNDARNTRNALSRLSTHELEDIGITRADIETVARTSNRF